MGVLPKIYTSHSKRPALDKEFAMRSHRLRLAIMTEVKAKVVAQPIMSNNAICQKHAVNERRIRL